MNGGIKMPSESKHLERIMAKHNRVANLQVVFADVEKYSQRRTLTQTEVIDRFTNCLGNALKSTAKEFVEYAQANDINFQTDIITLPTGDGAAIVFTFDGLHDIHLYFAKQLLKEIYEANGTTPCDKYNEQGWCNCHSNLGVRIGISEGRGIVYKDINGNFNVAGGVINLAARVMGQADRDQIIFTKDAFKQIIDMVDDPDLVDRFAEFRNIKIKHNLEIDVYQYTGEEEPYINSNPSKQLSLSKRSDEAIAKMTSLGFPTPEQLAPKVDREGLVGLIENMANAFSLLQPEKNLKPAIDIQKEDDKE